MPRARSASPPLEFCAIDFETANTSPNSACAVGLVRVRGSNVVASDTWLIRPPFRRFDFTYIHGITWDDVRDSPTFADLWDGIAPYLEGVHFIAAHNASFDRRVLEACARHWNIALPPLTFLCTLKLARQVWNIRPTNLPHVANTLQIPLEHHVAASDAHACAHIVIRAHQDSPEALPVRGPGVSAAR
jgi:DNA polymerase-3 subunit epsilon